jgi:purine-nucleoside phosphorylase
MKSDTRIQQVNESAEYIFSRGLLRPKIAIILGSGLGEFADKLSDSYAIPTADIPHYPVSTVIGHRGRIVIGKIGDVPLMAFQGRVHFYETGRLETVLYPIRVAHALGITTTIMTNAAGGVNPKFSAGDLMMMTDQINLSFEQPLKGAEIRSSKFELYDAALQKVIRMIAKKNNIKLQSGVYCGVKGPSYETAAEIHMVRKIGGDAVGMSTVNEVSLATALGINVAGISCITNLATGVGTEKLSHEEVTEVANTVKQKFSELIKGVVTNINS